MDIEQVRRDTPGCANKIFLNSAGASLMTAQVVDTITAYLQQEQEWGGYETARRMTNEIEAFYTEIAALIHADPTQIAVAFNATDAFSKALSAIPFLPGDCILTTNDDYVSNHIAFLSMQKRFGLNIVRTGNLPNGDIDFEDFERLMKQHRPKLVAVTHIPTSSGLIQDVERVGEYCAGSHTWYLLDACQSVGQIVVDVQRIKCDFLSATGRKFLRGPRGTGFLYVSNRVIEAGLEPLFIDLKGANWKEENRYELAMNGRRFEEFEYSCANLMGLTTAVRNANQLGIQNIQSRNALLASRLRQNLSSIPGLRVMDRGSNLGSIVTFHAPGSLNAWLAHLSSHQVIHSVTNRASALYDLGSKGVDWVIRFSPHYFNLMDEMDEVAEILKKFPG